MRLSERYRRNEALIEELERQFVPDIETDHSMLREVYQKILYKWFRLDEVFSSGYKVAFVHFTSHQTERKGTKYRMFYRLLLNDLRSRKILEEDQHYVACVCLLQSVDSSVDSTARVLGVRKPRSIENAKTTAEATAKNQTANIMPADIRKKINDDVVDDFYILSRTNETEARE